MRARVGGREEDAAVLHPLLGELRGRGREAVADDDEDLIIAQRGGMNVQLGEQIGRRAEERERLPDAEALEVMHQAGLAEVRAEKIVARLIGGDAGHVPAFGALAHEQRDAARHDGGLREQILDETNRVRDVAQRAETFAVAVVDVIFREGFVHPDAEEIEHLRAVGEVRKRGALEARVGVAGRVRHRVLADDALGIAAQTGGEMLDDVAVDHRAELADLPKIFAVPREVRRAAAEPFHVHHGGGKIERVAGIIRAAKDVVAERLAHVRRAARDVGDGGVLVENARVDVEQRLVGGGRGGGAVGAELRGIERAPRGQPVIGGIEIRTVALEPVLPEARGDFGGRGFLPGGLGLRGLAADDVAHPFGETDFVAVIVPEKFFLEAVLRQLGADFRDVLGRGRIAIAHGHPGFCRGHAGLREVLELRRAAVGGMQRAHAERGVEFGVFAAEFVGLAEGHPTAVAERLGGDFADGAIGFEVREHGVELRELRGDLLALAGITREIKRIRSLARGAAFHRAANGAQLDVERLAAAGKGREMKVRGVLQLDARPRAARAGRDVRGELGFVHVPREAVVNVIDAERGGLRAAIGEARLVTRAARIAKGLEQRIKIHALVILGEPRVLRVAREVKEIDVAIGGDAGIRGLRLAAQMNARGAGGQSGHADKLLDESLRSPRGIVLRLGLHVAEREAVVVFRAHEFLRDAAAGLHDFHLEARVGEGRIFVAHPEFEIARDRHLHVELRRAGRGGIETQQAFAGEVLEADDIDHVIARAVFHDAPAGLDREILGLDGDGGRELERGLCGRGRGGGNFRHGEKCERRREREDSGTKWNHARDTSARGGDGSRGLSRRARWGV